MRLTVLLTLLVILPSLAPAQTRTVFPGEVSLTLSIEETGHVPVVREMVLVTIRGVYRRHITRESLIQPDLSGFNWSQLGPDSWREERLDGKKVKIFERRMAFYPNRAGEITIGPFRHNLTLTDEGDDWFDHEISSAPMTITVAPAPAGANFFFPVKRLEVSDRWSNPPDQLKPGEGVLRVVQLEAHGAVVEMIPPMPVLTSPSAMIFPHPEKRIVELSPEGPIVRAFWRWTIRPGNDVSAIVEPMKFTYFNTAERRNIEVTIGAQRVAYGDLTPDVTNAEDAPPRPATLPGRPAGLLGAAVFCMGTLAGLAAAGRRLAWTTARGLPFLDPEARQLRRAARCRDTRAVRASAAAILARDGASKERSSLLSGFDHAHFSPSPRPDFNLKAFARAFLRAQRRQEISEN